MVGGIDPNVVDGPVSWQAPLAIPRGRRKMDLFGFARPATVLVRGRPNKTMPVYYDEFEIPDHTRIFQYNAGVLPAVLLTRNLLWSEIGDSS